MLNLMMAILAAKETIILAAATFFCMSYIVYAVLQKAHNNKQPGQAFYLVVACLVVCLVLSFVFDFVDIHSWQPKQLKDQSVLPISIVSFIAATGVGCLPGLFVHGIAQLVRILGRKGEKRRRFRDGSSEAYAKKRMIHS